jgi:hypothetical protein
VSTTLVNAAFLTLQLGLVAGLVLLLSRLATNAALGARRDVHRIALTLVALVLLANLVQVLVSPVGRSTVDHSVSYLIGARAEDDSWLPMQGAIERLRAEPQGRLYQGLFFEEGVKFQYPPTSLVVPDLIQGLTGSSWERVWQVVNTLSWVALPLIGVLGWRIYRRALVDATGREPGPWEGLIGLGVGVMVVIGFYPLTRSVLLGQVQTLLSLGLVASLYAWQTRHRRTAGVLLGLCCAFKPHWAVLAAWALLRREHRFWIACAVSFGLLGLGSLLMYGLQNHLDYLQVLSFLSRHGEAYYANQSVNGLMNRLLETQDSLQWSANAFPDYNPWVHGVTFVSSLALLAAAAFVREHDQSYGLGYAIVLLALTMASPIAWEHHYGFAVVLPFLALAHAGARGVVTLPWLAALGLGYVLMSQFLPETDLAAGGVTGLVQSYLFVGALVIVAALVVIQRRLVRG